MSSYIRGEKESSEGRVDRKRLKSDSSSFILRKVWREFFRRKSMKRSVSVREANSSDESYSIANNILRRIPFFQKKSPPLQSQSQPSLIRKNRSLSHSIVSVHQDEDDGGVYKGPSVGDSF